MIAHLRVAFQVLLILSGCGHIAGAAVTVLDQGIPTTGGGLVDAITPAPGGAGIVAGGYFQEIQRTGQSALAVNNLALWDGTVWHDVGNGTSGPIYALGCVGTKLYVAGFFTQVGGTGGSHVGGVAASSIAVWDTVANTWSALGTGLDGAVNALQIDQEGAVYVVGTFSHAGGVAAAHVAKWNGSWSAVTAGTAVGSENAACIVSDSSALVQILCGGADVDRVDFAGTTGTGYVPAPGMSGVGASVFAVAPLYAGGTVAAMAIGGSFPVNASAGVTSAGIAVAGSSGLTGLGGGLFDGAHPGTVRAILDVGKNGQPLCGGLFTTAQQPGSAPALTVANMAQWNGSQWVASASTDGAVLCLATGSDGSLYVAGAFAMVDGVATGCICKYALPSAGTTTGTATATTTGSAAATATATATATGTATTATASGSGATVAGSTTVTPPAAPSSGGSGGCGLGGTGSLLVGALIAGVTRTRRRSRIAAP